VKWIDVNNSLPEPFNPKLVCTELRGGVLIDCIVTKDISGFPLWSCETEVDDRVTHWMDLPELPEKE